MRKFFAISIMLAVLLTMAACGEEPELIDNPNPAKPLENADNTVMEYEGESISAGLYSFIFSYQKTYFLYYYQNLGVSDIVEDTQAFWNTETPNGLLGETAVNDINNHCRMIVLCNKMAEEHDVELGDAELEYIAEELNDLISAYGSTEGLSDYLRRFGIDVDDVEEYFNDKYLILALQNELCAKGGLCEVTDQMVEAEIKASYGKTTHIYLTDAACEGNATAKAEEILAKLNNGAELKDYASLSEDTTYKTYPEGTLITYNVDNLYSDTVKAIDAGEYAICTMNDGAYIIKKFELEDDDFDSLFESAYTTLSDEKFMALMEDRYGLVEFDADELNKYDIVTAETIKF